MNENAYDGLPSNKTSVILAKDAPHLKKMSHTRVLMRLTP